MASRSSAMKMSEEYHGTRRGRSQTGGLDWSMFEGKTTSTDMIEDPYQTEQDQRDTLRDFSPESTGLFAHEETRRNTHARERLNVREYGLRYSTMPYANEDFDTQFHDKDPRGWSTEQPWAEYRRAVEKQFQNIDFKDDGDYSTTSGHVHPNTLYKQIRGAQSWVKARLKIFETSWEGFSAPGVGVYDHTSDVFKGEMEDSSVLTDGTGPGMTFEDPENRQHHSTKLSNMVHGGSAALRANTTTDHKVRVAAYGKLYKARGLINHETQLRIVEDDTPWSRMEGKRQQTKNLVRLMASSVRDGEGLTVAERNRLLLQGAMSPTENMGGGAGRDETELANNKGLVLTRDIMALLGMTENEIRYLERAASENRKPAVHALAQLYSMAELLHSMPANAKLELKNELLLRAAGGSLRPGSAAERRQAMNQVIVNPKIVQMMDLLVRKSVTPGDAGENRLAADGDPQGLLAKAREEPVFVYRAAVRDADRLENAWESNADYKRGHHGDLPAQSYRMLAMYANDIAANRQSVAAAHEYSDTETVRRGKAVAPVDDYGVTIRKGATEVEFGENKALTRHVGRIGSKNMRRHQDTDYFSYDAMHEIGDADGGRVKKRKNPKNL